MVVKRMVVLAVAIALVCVAIGAGYWFLSGTPSVTPPGTAPTVTSTSPLHAATGIGINAKVTATFSEAMNPTTITNATFLLKRGTVAVPGSVTYVGTTATFTPTGNLGGLLAHTVTITTGAKDTSGQALAANYVWNFTTGNLIDTSAPRVSFTSPAPAAKGTPINAKILATFSEVMDASSISAATFTLKAGTTAVAGAVTYAGTTATLVPSANLAAKTAYTATITTGAKDTTGNALAANFVWGFTTGQTPDSTAPKVSSTSPVSGSTSAAINSKVLATFSEALDPSTVNSVTFTLKQGTTAVAGSVTYAGNTATFVPSANLVANTAYTATVTTGAKDLAGNALAANFAWGFRTGTAPDTVAPRVSFTSPPSAATGTPVNTQVLATFTEAMDPSTVTTTTFILTQGSTSISGSVSYAGRTATFVPSDNLASSLTYVATITTGARDLAGNALVANFMWTFTTGVAPDTTLPLVTSSSPAADATGVTVNSDISATFSEPMDPSTVTVSSFIVTQGTIPVSGFVSFGGLTAVFNPSDDFAVDTPYTAMITTQATDLAGNALQANFIWGFRTGIGSDNIRPIVTSTSPVGGGTAALSSDISATFSEAMDPLSISVSSFVLMQGSNPVSGSVSYAGLTATFDPASDLATDAFYTATITGEARDLAGNLLPGNFVWSFTTGASPCGQLKVNLGAADGFAIVAGSTVTSTGPSIINGDLALSPGSAVEGFPPATLNGVLHVADTEAAAAMGDLTIAYNDAQGRTLCPVSVAGNLGGQTLTPGLYKSTSGLEVTEGDLTLDAQGNPDAVFIFQMASTLVTSVGMKVVLAGGAKATNIFWAVGTSATLGGYSTFYGTIMADQSISFDTGATLEGRALARIGAVTMEATTITKPAA